MASSQEQLLLRDVENVHRNQKDPLDFLEQTGISSPTTSSPLPVASKLPRPWEHPGHGGIRGSLAWLMSFMQLSLQRLAVGQGSVTEVDPGGHVLGTSLGTS